MPTPEDRSFFEQLNKDLANSLERSILDAFKATSKPDTGISLSQGTIDAIGAAVGKGVEKPGDKPDEPDAKEPEEKGGAVGAGKMRTLLAGIERAINSMMALVGNNVENVFAYGDQIARASAQTNQTILRQTQKTTTSNQFLTDEFGKFGFNLRDVGGMLDTAMRGNVRGINVNTQKFIARTQGLGGSMDTTSKFLSLQTNVMGQEIDQSVSLGHILQDVATESGFVADAMFEAVNAFTDNTRKMGVIFGKEVGADLQKSLGFLAGRFGELGPDIKNMVAALSPDSLKGMIDLRRLGASVNANLGSEQMQADPQGHLAEAIMALAKIGEKGAGLTGEGRAAFIERRVEEFGVDKIALDTAMTVMSDFGGLGDLEKFLKTGAGWSGEKRAVEDKARQRHITGTSKEAAMNVKNFALETAAAATQFAAVDAAAQTFLNTLYELEDGFINSTRAIAGKAVGWTGIANEVMSVVGPVLDIASTVMQFRTMRGVGRLLGKGGGNAAQAASRGGRLARAGRYVGGATMAGFGGNAVLDAMTRPGSTYNMAAGGEGWLHKAPKGALKARAGLAGTAAKGVSKKIPVIGGLIAGGFELAETGDKSRAAATAVGAGGGAWAGAAGGAAIGTMIFPGVGTAIGGLIGGILGGWGGGEAAKAIHDEFDPEFVEEQRKRDQLELNAQMEQGTVGAAQAEDPGDILVSQGAAVVEGNRRLHEAVSETNRILDSGVGESLRVANVQRESGNVERVAAADDAAVRSAGAQSGALRARRIAASKTGANAGDSAQILNQGAVV